MDQIQISIGSECLPLNLPANAGTNVVDCFFEPNGAETDFDSVESATRKSSTKSSRWTRVDGALSGRGRDLPKEKLHEAFETALREGHLIPICFTSAETEVGVKEFLDAGCRLLPNPMEANSPPS